LNFGQIHLLILNSWVKDWEVKLAIWSTR